MFLSLNSSRIVTANGVQPITYAEILAWLQIHSIEGDQAEEYAHIVRVLDKSYLESLKNAKS